MLWEFLLLAIITWMVRRRWLLRRHMALAKQLKTTLKTYPIIGHLYMVLGSNEDRMRAWELFGRDAIKVGGVSKICHFDNLTICVADPAAADALLNQCLEKHDFLNVLDIVVEGGSFIAPASIWRHRRKIIATFFSTQNLTALVESFSEQSIALADRLEEQVGKGTFSLKEYTTASSINTVFEIIMGVKMEFQKSEFLKAMEELWQIAADVMLCQPWFANKFLLKLMPRYSTVLKHKRTVYGVIKKVIQTKQKIIDENRSHEDISRDKPKKLSFLDIQLGKPKLSTKELMEETLQLIVGYDINSNCLGFILLLLGRHLDVQNKVYEELYDVFSNSDRATNNEDLPRLKYLEAVIKETLRLYPLVPLVGRQVDNDVQLPSGTTIVKGCGILVNVWAVHRNPTYWGADADQFRPERFLDYTPKHPAAYMPFSCGPRGCPGNRYAILLMKTMLSTLLRRYRVLAPPGVPQGAPIRTKFEILLKHVDNYEVQLEYRK